MSFRTVLVVILLFALLTLVAGGTVALFDRLMKRRFQYSLRTLLIIVALVAVIFSAIASWNKWFKAQLEFLDPASPIVAKWNALPTIIEVKGDFKAVYQTRCRSVNEIQKILTMQGSIHGYTSRNPEGMIVVESSNRENLIKTIDAIQAADVLQPGKFCLRGLVNDAAGNPVPNAIVDLMGPSVYINYFQTRDDGSFSMPIAAPAQSGYYLRIRYGSKESQDTTTFSLDSAHPERFVIVHLR